jgi:hypothetical protein
MKKSIITILVACLLAMPVLSFAGDVTKQDFSITQYTNDYMQLAYCAKWEQQCKEDPFDPGKVECSQHCSQYVNDDGGSGGSQESGDGQNAGVVTVGSIVGLVLIAAILYWALTSPDK